jgi:hypothetical protein
MAELGLSRQDATFKIADMQEMSEVSDTSARNFSRRDEQNES